VKIVSSEYQLYACSKIEKDIALDKKLATTVESLKESITSP